MTPIDIEGALATAFNAAGLSACAPPLTPDYTAHLPFHLFTRTGGNIADRVITHNTVSVDVYGGTWAAAQTAAGQAASKVLSLEGSNVGGVPVYEVSVNLPYTNPDPRHPNVPRVTFTADLSVRMTD